MALVLGIDAAWTNSQPSGVALLREERGSWCVVGVAPSYSAFVELASGAAVDWQRKPEGSWPDVAAILEAAGDLGRGDVRVVAVDMPIAKVAIDSRRAADRAISRTFGGRGCGTHSPNKNRPGQLGAEMMSQLHSKGFPLATNYGEAVSGPCSIEVYPHPAILHLLSVDYRVPYKVARSTRYWQGVSIPGRVRNLMTEFQRIYDALLLVLGPLQFELPSTPDSIGTLAELKRYEDALDALVCAWVATRVVEGSASAYGDETASIWVPSVPAA